MCIYLDRKVSCKLLESRDQEGVESIWILMRSNSLPRQMTSIVLGVIYHSTRNREPENVILREHVQENLDAPLAKQPNALVLLTGDFNPTTTGFQEKYITQANHLKKLITFKTRNSGTLDRFFTNRSKLFNVSQLSKVGSSVLYTILVKPVAALTLKYTINKIMTKAAA